MQNWKPLIAEFIGTFALIFIGAGAICLDVTKGGVGLVGIALAHGLAIAVMVSAVGHISGGHLNPAVTIGAWVAKKISTPNAVGYILAQLAGATVAACKLKYLYPALAAAPTALGTPMLASTLTFGQGICVEAILTFFLVFVVFGTGIDPRGSKIGGLAIGLAVTMDILMGGPLTGAAMNPARAFGPALVSGYWMNQSLYWIGPIAGGLLAGLIYKWAFLKD